jgi:protein-tyrosine-phosphatase
MVNGHKKFRVLFVCSGNTCRSPMASAALSAMLPASLRERVVVDSAGAFTSGGQPATPAAVDALTRAGIDAPEHRSRALTRQLIVNADLILTMEPEHRAAVLELDPSAGERTHVLHVFATDEPRTEDQVHDPYGGSPEIYEESLSRIRRHLERVINYLEDVVSGAGSAG